MALRGIDKREIPLSCNAILWLLFRPFELLACDRSGSRPFSTTGLRNARKYGFVSAVHNELLVTFPTCGAVCAGVVWFEWVISLAILAHVWFEKSWGIIFPYRTYIRPMGRHHGQRGSQCPVGKTEAHRLTSVFDLVHVRWYITRSTYPPIDT